MAEISFDDYDGLKAALALYLNRRDLTDQIPGFIRLAHAKFNRELRVRDMQVRSEASSDDEYVALPSDFLEMHSLEIDAGGVWSPPLKYISEQEAIERRASLDTAGTRFYTIYGSELELVSAPTTSIDYRLKYYAKIPVLSATNTTNWLLTKSPDIYLYGSLLEAVPYLKNDERVPLWTAARQKVIDDMHAESERALRPQAGGLAIRPKTRF